ncbi:arrestin domain-containing protein 1-like [Macrobrachium rosenbergii]|uniref:arrestin domain-containing protein 1-like n=1 Tax=Macrobrachium rosenbergii TaxID=79674 RepID=UPI0034D6D333
MPTTISVVFHNPAAVYFSGQTIAGHVQVVCDKPKSCRGIEVEFKGYGKVHWTERHTTGTGDNRRTETRHYTSNEVYYKNKYYVWGNGSSTSELPPGTHVFNFSFLLPQGIPSSFESHIGRVRHHCKAKMDIPWKVDKTCLRPYSVNTLYDLNTDPQAMMKIECNKHDYMCCLWCRSGPLSLVLRVDRSGFVPGENMSINAEISNMTRVKINFSKAQIHQKITYFAQGKQKAEHRKVAERKHSEIAAGGDDIWSGDALLIPPLPPSHLQFCNIINIDYEFEFEVEPSGCHGDLEHKVPIVIGSIPLKQYFNIFANGFPGQPPVAGALVPGQPAPGFASPTAPGFVPPTAPGFVPPTAPGFVPPTAPGFVPPTAPGFGQPEYPSQPSYNPAMPPQPGFGDMNPTAYNPNMPPPAYPGPPQPSAPMFPGAVQYPGMPIPVYNPCMFGVANFTEDDSDDEHGNNGMKFAPHYISYTLVNAKHQQSGYDNSSFGSGMVTERKRHGSGSSSSSSEHAHCDQGDKTPLVIHHHHHHHSGSESEKDAPVCINEPDPVPEPVTHSVPEHDSQSSHSSSSSSSSEEAAGEDPVPEEEPEEEPEEPEPEPEPEEPEAEPEEPEE